MRPNSAQSETTHDVRTSSQEVDALLVALARADPILPEEDLAGGTCVAERYRVVSTLGRGGFGVVYDVEDGRIAGRRLALKILRRRSPEGEQSFAIEAQLLARVSQGPGIVSLHDYGVWDGRPYLVFELLRGATLANLLRDGPLPSSEALRIAVAVGRSLEHAHAQQVLHRDLKPSNVFVTATGEVKLLDFGLAQRFDASARPGGTRGYMAPEIWRGEPGDERSDVFSAAVMLFVMLTSKLPFADRGVGLNREGPPNLNPMPGSPQLVRLLQCALAFDPRDRPASAAAWRRALEGTADSETLSNARVDRLLTGLGPWLARCTLPWPSRTRGTWLLLALVVVAGVLIPSGYSPRQERSPLEERARSASYTVTLPSDWLPVREPVRAPEHSVTYAASELLCRLNGVPNATPALGVSDRSREQTSRRGEPTLKLKRGKSHAVRPTPDLIRAGKSAGDGMNPGQVVASDDVAPPAEPIPLQNEALVQKTDPSTGSYSAQGGRIIIRAPGGRAPRGLLQVRSAPRSAPVAQPHQAPVERRSDCGFRRFACEGRCRDDEPSPVSRTTSWSDHEYRPSCSADCAYEYFLCTKR